MPEWKEWRDLSPGPPGTEVPRDEAWLMLNAWQESTKEIGVISVSRLSTIRALARLTSVRDGTIEVTTAASRTSFHLHDATFLYGPMQAWPRWPDPPIVEVMALHALLPSGTWLCLAEGLKPEALPPQLLPG